MEWRYRHTVLVLLMGAFFSVMVARLVISPLIPTLMDAFDVSKGAMGLVLTGLWGTYALFQLPGGVLAGRYGERAVVVASLGLTGVGSLLLALAPSYAAFLVFALLMGAGSGFYFPAAASLLTRLHDNTGQALGFHLSGGDSAGLVAPVIAAVVGVQFGWRVAMLAGVAVIVPVLLVCAFRIQPMSPQRPGLSLRERADPRTLLSMLLTPSIAYTTLLAVVLAFAFQAVISFYPTFLIEAYGFSTADASLLYSGIFAIWIPLLPVMGRVADRLTHDTVLGGTMLSLILGFLVALTAGSGIGAGVAVGFLGMGMSFGGVLAARFMVNLSPEERTEGYGLVRGVYMLLGSTGSVVTGTVADIAGWTAAYGLVGVLVTVVLGSVVANRTLGLGL